MYIIGAAHGPAVKVTEEAVREAASIWEAERAIEAPEFGGLADMMLVWTQREDEDSVVPHVVLVAGADSYRCDCDQGMAGLSCFHAGAVHLYRRN